MSKKLQIDKESKLIKVPYELFPTEKGVAKPQLIRLYDNAISLQYDINVEYTTLDMEDEPYDDGFKLNKIAHLDKASVSSITLETIDLLQLDSDKEQIQYTRPVINIICNNEGYAVWCKEGDEAITLLNELLNWRWK